MSFVKILVVASLLSSCVTTQGWEQEGKTERDRIKDNGECRAQANQVCPNDAFGLCINNAYGECMIGRGWSKE